MIWRPVRALVLPNGQHACGVQALFEQEVTEGTEKGYSLCLLCFLLFKIRCFGCGYAALRALDYARRIGML